MSDEDKFKPIFKYYKSKLPPPKLDNVINISKETSKEFVSKISPITGLINHEHLKDSNLWNIFNFSNGVIIIRNPFKSQGISFWVHRCLQDFSQSKNNLQNPHWFKDVTINHNLTSKLRWSTLGIHHDWDTKIYDENDVSPFPHDLAELCQILLAHSDCLPMNYKAEAAIINYYPMNSSLGAHVDHSEPNKREKLSLGKMIWLNFFVVRFQFFFKIISKKFPNHKLKCNLWKFCFFIMILSI